MKNIKRIPLILCIGIFFALLATSCKKDSNSPAGNNGNGNNNNGNGNNSNSTITYVNDTYTPITIIINNQTQTIAIGSKVVIKGAPGTNITGTASTSGETSTGTQVGLLISWNLNNTFPSSGNFSENLDVGSNYFFLKIQNKSNLSITRIFVNYGLAPQTEDDVTVNNNSIVYSIGYYQAFTNSNVRGENGQVYWQWNNLNLSFANNQSTTVIANP